MAEHELSQALSSLRIKGHLFDFEYFSREDFSTQDVINTTSDMVLKNKRGVDAGDQSWDRIDQLLDAFER